MSEMVSDDPDGRELDQHIRSAAIAHEESLARCLDEIEAEIRALVSEGLTRGGFRSHRGQWRKKRNEK